MMQISDKIPRKMGTKSIKKQYFLIYEGELTEPDYFTGIIDNKETLKIAPLIDMKNIGRPESEWYQTDIIELLNIARSYIMSVKKHKFHIKYFLNQMFEQFCGEKRKTLKEFGSLKNYEDYLNTWVRDCKIIAENEIIKNYSDSDGYITDVPSAVKICKELIKDKFGYVTNHFDLASINRITLYPIDDVCIIHDRDYSEKFFNDEKYKSALEISNNNSEEIGVRFRMIITYPKFELWLIMHHPRWNEDVKLMKEYPYAGDQCSNVYRNLYSSYFGDKEKKITPEMFKEAFLNNISLAIERSMNYSTDIQALMTEPGTNLGLLLNEIINSKED